METQHFSILVNAPANVVWQTMFDDSTYRQWTSVFNPDSYFEGAWLPGQALPKDGWLTPSDGPGFGLEIPEQWLEPFFGA